MPFKVGDIVVANNGAPYAITRPGTRWTVYATESPNALSNMIVGTIPDSNDDFERFKDFIDGSYMSRKKRTELGLRFYHVASKHFRYDTSLTNNRQQVHLLSQGDIWAEEKKPSKWKKTRYGNQRQEYPDFDDGMPF